MATAQFHVAAGTDDAFSSSAPSFNSSYPSLSFGMEPGKPPQDTDSFYVRFAVDLPSNAVIAEAKITFTCHTRAAASAHTYNAQIEDVQDADPLTDKPTDLAGTPVVCNIPDIYAEETWQSADLTSLLQTWLDGIGGDTYTPGDHVVFCFMHQSSGAVGIDKWYSYEGDPSKAAILDVVYTVPVDSFRRVRGNLAAHTASAAVVIDNPRAAVT